MLEAEGPRAWARRFVSWRSALLSGLLAVTPARAEGPASGAATLRQPVRSARFAPLRPTEVEGKVYYPYSFDGHVHTHHSPDAFHPPAEVLAEAERLGLDAVVITDHGSSRAKFDFRGYKGRIVPFVGQEIGGPYGHAVFWNVEAKQGVPPLATSLAERAAFAHAQGGLIVLCHPGWWIQGRAEDPMRWIEPDALRKGGLSGEIDALELWNGVYDAPLRKLIEAWEGALEAGVYMPIVGNSDFHRLGAHRIGGPRNVAYCTEAAPDRCLWEAVRAGRLYITDGPSLLLTVDGAPLGAEVKLRAHATLDVSVRGDAPQGGSLRIFLGRSVVRSVELAVGQAYSHSFRIPGVKAPSYVRVEIVRRLGESEEMLLLSNPVRVLP